MATLIIIAGRKRVGKSTSARYISDKLNRSHLPEIVSFANPIKTMTDILFGLAGRPFGSEQEKASETGWVWDDLQKECWKQSGSPNKIGSDKVTVREILQLVGTMFRNHFCATFWENILCDYIKDPSDREVVIIDDCRLPQELNIKPKGYSKILRVYLRRASVAKDNVHYTETALENAPLDVFDEVIDNDGDIDALYKRLDKLLDAHF